MDFGEVSGGSQTVRNTHTCTKWSTMQSTATTLHFILTVKLNQLLQCAPFQKDMNISLISNTHSRQLVNDALADRSQFQAIDPTAWHSEHCPDFCLRDVIL